jgi:superfamily II DNA or RNA helicase
MNGNSVVRLSGVERAVLRQVDDFGIKSYDLVSPPRRILGPDEVIPLVEYNVDGRRIQPSWNVMSLLDAVQQSESWLNISQRTLARIAAAFMVAEDPQGRLNAQKAATLMHQASLVQHVLASPNLRKALIADEVGLGKTIEAGLIVKRLLAERPRMRVLYLAPARLVSNVVGEFRQKLDLDARRWVAGGAVDARIDSDQIVVASIHKAVFGRNAETVLKSGPWDLLIVDECHHLSDWDPNGGSPNQGFRLVSQLVKQLPPDGRLLLLSGTPHQGSEARFSNLLRLLSDDAKSIDGAAGRVIFRTKDKVRDWRGRPLFPLREIHPPKVVQMGAQYEAWYHSIAELYEGDPGSGSAGRAAGWAKGQALQWASSSVQAGLGYLSRLGMRRLGWTAKNPALQEALLALRPYRGGERDEPIGSLFERVRKQIGIQEAEPGVIEDEEEFEDEVWRPDPVRLESLLRQGVALIGSKAATAKWVEVSRLIDAADGEKIVLFAQPVETVGVVAQYLRDRYGAEPCMIVGNQSEEERSDQVARFQREDGPRFLVSSRAGGEGLNMQRARRLINLDIPWNPMELEQRIGRVHRFGSRKTVLIDSVVAAGSREVDMYRIARDKLHMIATHLDPDQFETLFSRVMSLVPPKELEDIVGGTPASAFPGAAATEIGRLVTEGYRAWSDFDDRFRKEAEKIKTISAGTATWDDLGAFLTKYCNALASGDASFTGFEFRGDEVIAIAENVPVIEMDGVLYACGDSGGVPFEARESRPVVQLGLNVPEVITRLRQHFLAERPAGAAVLKRPAHLASGPCAAAQAFVLLLRQTIRSELGRASEVSVSLAVFSVLADGGIEELDGSSRGDVIRALLQTSRVKEPARTPIWDSMPGVVASLVNKLRQPTDDELSRGDRHVVWPIGVVLLQ